MADSTKADSTEAGRVGSGQVGSGQTGYGRVGSGQAGGLDRAKVDQVAYLARLAIADEEKDKLTAELQAILGFVDLLSEVNTDGVKPMTSVVEVNSPLREDKVTDGGYPERILANAPDRVQDFFAVPKVVE